MIEFKNKRIKAPQFVAYILALSYIVMLVLLVLTVVKWGNTTGYIMLGSLIGVILLNILCDFGFSWMKETKIKDNKDMLEITVIDVLGEKYIYKINVIDKITKVLTRTYIKGDIIMKEPKRNEKEVNKIYLEDCSKEAINLLRKYENK